MQETTPNSSVREEQAGRSVFAAVTGMLTLNADKIILSFLLVATGVAYILHWSFTVDDAAISFSYARNFASGFGLGALYPGAARVEGYSNLLWVILLGAGTWLGLDTILVSKILGLLFALGAMLMLFLSLRDFIRNRWLLGGLVLLPISLTFTFWSVSGLENSLYAFLILLAVFLLVREDKNPARIPFGSSITLILVGMTRPEGLIYALAGLGYKIIQLADRTLSVKRATSNAKHLEDKGHLQEERRLSIRNLLLWLAIFLLGYGLFKVWHWGYFAALWPNPIYAKAGWYGKDLNQVWFQPDGWIYLRGYFRSFAAVGIIPVLIFGGLVSLRGQQRIFPIFALAALALPLYTSDWMVNYRFVYPFLPFEIALLVLAADQLWTWMFEPQNRTLWKRIAAVTLAVWFGFGVARFAWANLRLTERQLACGYNTPMAETRCLDGKMYWSMAEVDQKYTELQGYAKQVGLSDPLYMIPDIGATSYQRNLRILDMAGLGDYQLARIHDGALLKQYLFQERRPDFILTYGQWTRRTDLTSFSAFRDNYLPIEQGKDQNGLEHGTYIRKDLLISPGSNLLPAPDPEHESGSILPNRCKFSPGLSLVNIFATPAHPTGGILADETRSIETFWLVNQSQTQDWNLTLKLLNNSGAMVDEQTQPLGYGWYPTSAWQPDEIFRQHLRLPDNLPDGDYIVELHLNPSEPGGLDENTHSQATPTAPLYSTAECSIGISVQTGSSSEDVKSQLTALLNNAQLARQHSDLEMLVSYTQAAAALQERAHAEPEWRNFGNALRLDADQAMKQKDWKTAYHLYLAASITNPDDAWAQYGLEEARRNDILGGPESNSQAIDSSADVLYLPSNEYEKTSW